MAGGSEESTKSHGCEWDQDDTGNHQPTVGMPRSERKPEYPGDDHGNQLHERSGVGVGEEQIDDEVHNSLRNPSRHSSRIAPPIPYKRRIADIAATRCSPRTLRRS